MNNFWMSGEIQADVDDAFRASLHAIEPDLNRRLEGASFGGKVEEWVFIAIIRREDHPDYGEIVRKASRGRSLEFRLKISHSEFLSATPVEQIRLILQARARSVSLMGRLGVS